MASNGFHQNTRPYLSLMFANPYYYPPLTAQLIYPLIFLPKQIAYGIWIWCSILAIILSVYCLVPRKYFLLGLLIAFGFLPVEVTLYAGQVCSLLLLALSFAYYAISRNQSMAAGFGLAAGIMLKIIPLVHLAYFIWRGKLTAAFATLLGLLLFFAISLPFAGGWQGWLDFFHVAAYYGHPTSLHAHGFNQTLSVGFNQALSGFFARLIPSDLLSIKLSQISAAILTLATIAVCWPPGRSQSLDLEFGLITITVNLIMPYTWYYQYIILLIPIFIIIRRAEQEQFFRQLLWPLFIGYVITDLHGLFWHHLNNAFLSSSPLFFALLLWFSLSYQIIMQRKRSRQGQESSYAQGVISS